MTELWQVHQKATELWREIDFDRIWTGAWLRQKSNRDKELTGLTPWCTRFWRDSYREFILTEKSQVRHEWYFSTTTGVHCPAGRFRSVNQRLNDKGRCCEVRAQTLPKIPTLAAVDSLLMRYAMVTTSENKKFLKITNSSKMVIYTNQFEILCRTIF